MEKAGKEIELRKYVNVATLHLKIIRGNVFVFELFWRYIFVMF